MADPVNHRREETRLLTLDGQQEADLLAKHKKSAAFLLEERLCLSLGLTQKAAGVSWSVSPLEPGRLGWEGVGSARLRVHTLCMQMHFPRDEGSIVPSKRQTPARPDP